jgi:hypothetical protein
MPNDECSDLKREAHEAGDLHYRAMTDYIRGDHRGERKRALRFAMAYRQALQWLLDCYGRAKNRLTGRQQAETALQYAELVDKDIEMIKDTSV